MTVWPRPLILGIAYPPPPREPGSPAWRHPGTTPLSPVGCLGHRRMCPAAHGDDIEEGHPPDCVVRVRFTGPMGSRRNPHFWWSGRPCQLCQWDSAVTFHLLLEAGVPESGNGKKEGIMPFWAFQKTLLEGQTECVAFNVDSLGCVEPESTCVSFIYLM